MTAAITLEGLCKTYPRAWLSPAYQALHDVSLSVVEGETFGFIGPNGAGKSTTIKILTGVLRATSGSATLFGQDVSAPEARRGLGYVPENPSLPDYLTPFELLEMGTRLHSVQLDDRRRHCMAWLERFELAQVAHKMIRSFSKGMVQRTALAHAMAVRPRLLVLDEPLSGLDPVGRRDVVDILSAYKHAGGTLFFTSHVLHDVERLADRFGLIHQGRLKAVRSPAELSDEEEHVVVRSLGTTPVAGMQEEFSGRWQAEIRRADLWVLLDALRGAGHVLVEVKPTLSLESAFLRAIGR